jgi:hypothetical protein
MIYRPLEEGGFLISNYHSKSGRLADRSVCQKYLLMPAFLSPPTCKWTSFMGISHRQSEIVNLYIYDKGTGVLNQANKGRWKCFPLLIHTIAFKFTLMNQK